MQCCGICAYRSGILNLYACVHYDIGIYRSDTLDILSLNALCQALCKVCIHCRALNERAYAMRSQNYRYVNAEFSVPANNFVVYQTFSMRIG